MIRRPALRYHGGKWKLAPWIIEHFPGHRVYTESFGGGASVLLRKERSYAEIYNDLDGDVVNLFRVLREPAACKDLKNLLRLTPFARAEFELAYEVTEDAVERARRTIIRSFMGFGSAAVNPLHKTGFRANSNRSGTTPAHDWINYPDNLDALCTRLQGVTIESRPASQVMTAHDGAETLHYVDPPYVLSTRNSLRKNGCYRHEMTDADHEELASVLHGLSGMVVLSGYPSDLYTTLYADWSRVECDALADGAQKRTEVLWLNQRASEALNLGAQQAELFQESTP